MLHVGPEDVQGASCFLILHVKKQITFHLVTVFLTFVIADILKALWKGKLLLYYNIVLSLTEQLINFYVPNAGVSPRLNLYLLKPPPPLYKINTTQRFIELSVFSLWLPPQSP